MRASAATWCATAAVATIAGPVRPRDPGITTYLAVPGHETSTAFARLTVAGRPVTISEYKGVGYARLALRAGADVSVTARAPIASCDVRPRALAIATSVRGSSCTFTVPGPGKLELGVGAAGKLFLFVEAPEIGAPPCCDGVTVFDATKYGNVDPTGAAKSTGIQAAIDDVARRSACTNASPCTLYFKQGTYLAKQLFLKSRVKLYLESGARLKASTDPADYKLDPGTHRTAFITAEGVSHSGIYGRGAIDGDGLAYRRRNSARSQYPYWNCRTTTSAMCWDSPRLILIRRSRQVTVKDVMLLDPAAWTNHVHYSEQVTYDNVKVMDDRTKFNTDAMDVDASIGVTVRNSFYHGRDDGFCVKATGELGLIRPSTGIRFLDNTVGYGNSAAKLGTETYPGGNMDDILVRNLYVTGLWGRAFGVYVKDGNTVGATAGVRVEGVHVDTGGEQGFAIEITKRKSSSAIGRVDHVTIADLHLPAGIGTSTIYGYDSSHRVSNVSISGLRIGGVLKNTLAGARIAKNAYTSNIAIR